MANPMTITFPVSPGDIIYEVGYKPCHFGETHPHSSGCDGCEDKCDIKKEIKEFCVPDIDWVLKHYKDLDKNIWFTSKENAENKLGK